MKKYIKHFTLAIFSLVVLQSYGQNGKKEGSALKNEKIKIYYICDNGGFELGNITNYSFNSSSSFSNFPVPSNIDCNYITSTLPPYVPTTLNDFSYFNYATLVNDDVLISGGFDPVLHSLPTPVNIPRVNTGTYAMKLNNDIGRHNFTSMSKAFHVYEDFISYSYSLIMYNYNNSAVNQPHFIVRLYDEMNVIVNENCIVADVTNPLFSTVYGGDPNTPILYTGWQCNTLSTKNAIPGSLYRLEFLITDGALPFDASYGTVYIDDICNVACPTCEYCVTINTDVLSGVDNQQAENCINADNTITAGASASYHAGHEVVLRPGFEALYGSKDRFYIEGCSGEFGLRTAGIPEVNHTEIADMSVNEMQVYPNPTNGELNIIAGDVAINSINVTGLDGKTIHVNQQGDMVTGNFKLDMGSVSKGIYLLTVEKKNGEIITQKIIKN